MNRSAWAFGICILAVACGALAFRLPQLSVRPMHPDEANQAVKAGAELYDHGAYRYDPRDHHGPSLYYATLPALYLSGAGSFADSDEADYRIVPVVFGVGLVLLVLLVGDGLGRPASAAAAVLAAISPAMVFYSRYYIQEMMLVFFAFATVATAWRYVRSGRMAWMVASGVAVGLMAATKETWVLHLAAMGIGGAVVWIGSRAEAADRPRVRRGPVVAAVVVAAMVAFVFFSSFFANLRGPLDAVLAYGHYLDRAGGAGLHDKPWHYYLGTLLYTKYAAGPWWSEGLILVLAAVGLVAAVSGRGMPETARPFVRFLAVYTVVLTIAYSAIPYKTPWCLLGFFHGMILLAGVGLVALVRWMPGRGLKMAVGLIAAALAVQLGVQAYRASYPYAADSRNPYVYAHTSTDVETLVRCMDGLACVSPEGRHLLVKVVTPGNYWPLPWYLRQFSQVGYWHEVPADPDAAVIITSPDVAETLDASLRGRYDRQTCFGLRPTVLLSVWVEQDLWDAYQKSLATRPVPGEGG